MAAAIGVSFAPAPRIVEATGLRSGKTDHAAYMAVAPTRPRLLCDMLMGQNAVQVVLPTEKRSKETTMNVERVRLIRKAATLKDGTPVTYWVLRWSGSDGRTKSKSIGRTDGLSRRKAEQARKAMEQNLSKGLVPRDRSRLTLSAYLKLDRQAIAADVAPSTIRVHEVASQHAIEVIGANVRLDRVAWADVVRLKTAMTNEKGLSKATVRKVIATLKASWNRALKRELVARNPFAKEGGTWKQQPRAKRIFDHAEVAAMLAAAPTPWWRAMIRLLFTTGLRIGEAMNLTWDDIDRESGQIVVSRKRRGGFDFGDETYPVFEWSTKSHAERSVPAPPDVFDLLDPLRFRRPHYVFVSLEQLRSIEARLEATGRLPQPGHWVNNLLRDFKRIQGRARAAEAERRKVEIEKIEWPIGTFHDLRKSYGTHLARSGCPMRDLKDLMGHSSIVVTEQFYTEPDSSVGERVASVFAVA